MSSGPTTPPAATGMMDRVGLTLLHKQLENICDEMAVSMMRTAYSPIFSEGLDFSTLILDPSGNLFLAGNFTGSITIDGETKTSAGKSDIYLVKLDAQGNSVRGILACKELPGHFGLHAFEFTNVGSSFMQWLL